MLTDTEIEGMSEEDLDKVATKLSQRSWALKMQRQAQAEEVLLGHPLFEGCKVQRGNAGLQLDTGDFRAGRCQHPYAGVFIYAETAGLRAEGSSMEEAVAKMEEKLEYTIEEAERLLTVIRGRG